MKATSHGIRATRRLLAAVALACLALPALAAPALASPTWLPPTDLSAPLRDAHHVGVAMADSGETVAIWERQTGISGIDNVQLSTRAPGGSFSSPVDLSTHAKDPVVAMTPGGEAVAVWSRFVNPPGTYVIEAATRAPGGSFSAPTDVFSLPPGVIPPEPRLAVNAAGDVAVAWQEVDPDSGLNALFCEPNVHCPNPSFLMASVRPAGGSFSEAVRVSPPRGTPQPGETEEEKEEREKEESHRAAFGGQVAIDAAGDVTAVWTYFNGTDDVAQAATRPAGGSFGPPETISESGADTFSPDVAMDAAGNTVAVWSHEEGADDIVQASTRSPGGSFNPPVDLSAAGGDARESEAAMTPAGSATVIWTFTPEESGRRVIQATTRPSGGSFSAPGNLSLPEEEPLFPTLAMDSAGDTVVAWSGTSGPGIVTRAVTRPAGGSFSTPAEISGTTPTCCFHPDAAVDATADATVVWNRSDGSNEIAQAAGYDADAPQLRNLSIPATGTVGVPVSFSVDPFDVWPVASTKFEFGDGAAAAGTNVSHVYGSPGTFQVTATAVDAGGTATTAGGTISILASNDFKLGKVKRNKKTGRATIIVEVPGPGKLTLSGKGVKKVVRTAQAAGAVRLTIAPNRRTLKKLNERHRAKVKLTITFAPTGGNPATKRLSLVLIKKS